MTVLSAIARKGMPAAAPRAVAVRAIFWLLAMFALAGMTPPPQHSDASEWFALSAASAGLAAAEQPLPSVEADKSIAALAKFAPAAPATGESSDDAFVAPLIAAYRPALDLAILSGPASALRLGVRCAAFHQRAPPLA